MFNVQLQVFFGYLENWVYFKNKLEFSRSMAANKLQITRKMLL
jgi:hypothetical protein